MKLTTTLALLSASFSSLTTALPAPNAASLPRFILKTEVIAPDTKYNGMFVQPSHTGAGFNAAAVVKFDKNLVKSYLNNTELIFALGGDKVFDRYPMQTSQFDFESAWGYTSISIEEKADKGFKITSDGRLIATQFGDSSKFTWKVCLWNHQFPELFYNVPGFPQVHVPDSCSNVNLKVVSV